MPQFKVLHITAHLGGGIGKVLSSVAIQEKNINSDFRHEILTLEPTLNQHFEQRCNDNDILVYYAHDADIPTLLGGADIVQIEWWHHPLMMGFMYRYLPQILCRLVVWSHISGCNFPRIREEFVNFADKFIFATPYSYENPSWNENQKSEIIKNTRVVVSSGVDYSISEVQKVSHDGFNVGYVGYLGYNKTHPDFVKFCETAADIPGIYFSIVGDTSFGYELVSDAAKSTVADKLHFFGYRSDIPALLTSFDVFGYLLNPEHTGTAENALLEAMAAGITPVVLNQCAEKYTVSHGKTGLIVRNIEEYGNAIKWLYQNPIKRHELGRAASMDVQDKYSVSTTCAGLRQVYKDVIAERKSLHNTGAVFGYTPCEWFNSCYVGDMNHITGSAAANNKSGILQYKKYYPKEEFPYDCKN